MAISPDKLRAILGDWSDASLDVEPAAELAITNHDAIVSASVPASPTALTLDAWTIAKGADLHAASSRLQAYNNLGDAPELATADFFGAAFSAEPTTAENPVDRPRAEFVRALLESPDYRALHAETALDQLAANVAAISFAEQYDLLRSSQKKQEEERRKGGCKKGDDPETTEMERQLGITSAASKAVESAAEDVKADREARAACGMGAGSAAASDPDRILRFLSRTRRSEKLRRIFDLAGKMRRLAASKQRSKMIHGSDELAGVTLSDHLMRALPSELANLAHPVLRLDAIRRFAEKQLLTYEMRSPDKVGKGPVIVCVDQSGSMGGHKGESAMALGLAMAWIAAQQKRWCALLAFTGQSWTGCASDPDAASHALHGLESPFHRLLVLPRGRWDESAMLVWLEQFLGRGSHLDVPVRELPGLYEEMGAPRGKTDVIFITDAICRLSDRQVADFVAWKKAAQASVFSLIIGGRADGYDDAGSLNAVSDSLHRMPSLGLEEEGVSEVLSI